MSYDSRPDTYKHIQFVQKYMLRFVRRLMKQSHVHDQSKLSDPELSVFDEYTPKLKATTYGSDEYKVMLKAMQEKGLAHHYAHNSHHPEYYEEGVRGMSLIDIVEMLCDWKAATLRHDDGDLMRSIEINQKRFGFSDELKQILINTVHDLHLIEDAEIGHQQARRNKVWLGNAEGGEE